MARVSLSRLVNKLPRHSIIGRLVHPLLEERRTLAGRMSWIGIAIIAAFLFIALFAGFVAPFNPLALADQKDIPPWTNAPVLRNNSFVTANGTWYSVENVSGVLTPVGFLYGGNAQSVNNVGSTSIRPGQYVEVWDFQLDIKRDDVRAAGFAIRLLRDRTDSGHFARVNVSEDGGRTWLASYDIRTVGTYVRIDLTGLTGWSASTLNNTNFRFHILHESDAGAPGNLTVDYFGATATWLSYWHLMGTDLLGRDVFSRVLYGTRTSLAIMAIGVFVALAVGFPLGLYSGYRGGKFDKVLVLIMDSLYSFPGLLFAGLIAVLLGKGVVNIGLAVTVIYVPLYFRVTRSQVLSAREELYVEAARAAGARPSRIVFRYIAMNVIVAIPVIFSISAADAILTAAGLSYLGLGVEVPTPDWGLDLSAAAERIDNGIWWSSFFPGFVIVVLTVGLSFLGEGLNDIMNPLLKKERT